MEREHGKGIPRGKGSAVIYLVVVLVAVIIGFSANIGTERFSEKSTAASVSESTADFSEEQTNTQTQTQTTAQTLTTLQPKTDVSRAAASNAFKNYEKGRGNDKFWESSFFGLRYDAQRGLKLVSGEPLEKLNSAFAENGSGQRLEMASKPEKDGPVPFVGVYVFDNSVANKNGDIDEMIKRSAYGELSKDGTEETAYTFKNNIDSIILSKDGWKLYIAGKNLPCVYALSILNNGDLKGELIHSHIHRHTDFIFPGASDIAIDSHERLFAA